MDIFAPDSISTMVDALRRRADLQGEVRAYTFLHEGRTESAWLSWAELDRRAREIAARLQARGLEGERAILLYPPGIEFVAAFFGCLYAGVVAVPAYPPRPSGSSRGFCRSSGDARPAAALAPAATLAGLPKWLDRAPELGRLAWIATDGEEADADAADADDWRRPDLSPGSLAFLQYTSGSTAAPKGVMVSHGNLAAQRADDPARLRPARGLGGGGVAAALPRHGADRERAAAALRRGAGAC